MNEKQEKKYKAAFGRHLKAVRLEKGLSQLDLAVKMDSDKYTISKIENGNMNPSLIFMQRIADGLGIPLAELVNF